LPPKKEREKKGGKICEEFWRTEIPGQMKGGDGSEPRIVQFLVQNISESVRMPNDQMLKVTVLEFKY